MTDSIKLLKETNKYFIYNFNLLKKFVISSDRNDIGKKSTTKHEKKLKAYIESIYENIKIHKYKKVHIAI